MTTRPPTGPPPARPAPPPYASDLPLSQTLVRAHFEESLSLWPPYSPDLSPIESVWASMANMLRSELELPRKREDLIAIIGAAWLKATQPRVVRGHYEMVLDRMYKSYGMGGSNAMH